MTKRCTLCKKDLPVGEFNKKAKNKDGLQNVCRECNRTRSRMYYRDNRSKHLRAVADNNRRYSTRNRQLVRLIKIHNGCSLCGETEVCCLQFHHLDPSKKDFVIAKASGGLKSSVKTILNEIKKCVCVCANCHFKIHAGIVQINEGDVCNIEFLKLDPSVA